MSTAVERCVLVYGPGSSPADLPEQRPVDDADEAAELVEELAAEGIRAEPVSRGVTAWLPDKDAKHALDMKRIAYVREVVGEVVEHERSDQEAVDILARLTPDMGPGVRRYWVRDLAALLALDVPDTPAWVAGRIIHALQVLSGLAAPGPVGN
jgi:hypothetical protein